MMKLFAVRDVKSDSFGAPMSIISTGIALRGFTETVANPESNLNRYPEDYTLYEVGTYDPSSGMLTSLHPAPQLIASAVSVHPRSKIAATPALEEAVK